MAHATPFHMHSNLKWFNHQSERIFQLNGKILKTTFCNFLALLKLYHVFNCCCCWFIAIVLTCLCLLPACKGFFEVAFCGGLAIQMKLLSSILPKATLLQEEEQDLISTFPPPQRSNSFYLLIPALNGALFKLYQICFDNYLDLSHIKFEQSNSFYLLIPALNSALFKSNQIKLDKYLDLSHIQFEWSNSFYLLMLFHWCTSHLPGASFKLIVGLVKLQLIDFSKLLLVKLYFFLERSNSFYLLMLFHCYTSHQVRTSTKQQFDLKLKATFLPTSYQL